MAKRCPCFRKTSRRGAGKASGRSSLTLQLPRIGPSSPVTQPARLDGGDHDGCRKWSGSLVEGNPGKGKKMPGGRRPWMLFDRFGNSELVEWDKTAIVKRGKIPGRDLRALSSVTSQSCNILARERSIVLNLDFVRAIVTAEEVLMLDPLRQEVVAFIDQLRQQLPNSQKVASASDETQPELAFEFQVLEVALEVVYACLDSDVAELEAEAYPVLDQLAKNVSTSALEGVRTLKTNITRLLARSQKLRDEIEHLLDDSVDMAHLYLTRKRMQNQQPDKALSESAASDGNNITDSTVAHPSDQPVAAGSVSGDYDVEDLEMLLEAYFVQLDGTRNKILSIREYIDDTEDYVNIQLDNKRNELIQLQLILSSASLPVALETMVCGIFSMNIPCTLYNVQGIFSYCVCGFVIAGFLLFAFLIGYARWKKLLG